MEKRKVSFRDCRESFPIYGSLNIAVIVFKMWHPCGYNGRDWLWKNMPHSIHVWLTVWAWWTKEHATNEGINITAVCTCYLIFCIDGVIYP